MIKFYLETHHMPQIRAVYISFDEHDAILEVWIQDFKTHVEIYTQLHHKEYLMEILATGVTDLQEMKIDTPVNIGAECTLHLVPTFKPSDDHVTLQFQDNKGLVARIWSQNIPDVFSLKIEHDIDMPNKQVNSIFMLAKDLAYVMRGEPKEE